MDVSPTTVSARSVNVYTARIGYAGADRLGYAGADRLDITRKSAGIAGQPFAPSWKILGPMIALRRTGGDELAAWPKYAKDYAEEMRASWRNHRAAWDALLARDEVTLLCYCKDAAHCYRTMLAGLLAKLGATVLGESVS